MKFFSLFLLLSFCGYTQQNNKPYSYWYNETRKHSRVNTDSMLFCIKKMQSTANSSCEYMNALALEANGIYFKRECNSSKMLCKEILKRIDREASSLNDSCFFYLKTKTLGRLVYAEKCLGNYVEALEHISESLILNTQYPEYSEAYRIPPLYQSALIHLELEQYQKAIYLFREIFPLSKGYSDELLYPSIYISLGDSYLKLYEKSLKKDLLDSAKVSYHNYYNSAVKIKSQKKHTQKIYEIKKGIIALNEKQFDLALLHLQTASKIKLSEEKHFTNQEIDLYKAEAFYHLNHSDSTIYYGNQFLEKNTLFPKKTIHRLKVHSILAKAYNKNNDLDKALFHSSLALSEVKKIDVLKFNGIEKLNLIRLKQIKKKNQALISKKKNKWFLYGALVSSIIILTIFLFHYYTKKKKIVPHSNNIPQKEETKQEDIKQETLSGDSILSPPIPKSASLNTLEIDISDTIVQNILTGLHRLEKEKCFLKLDFNLKFIAQELNSNTSYISKVINFHKKSSFKEYTTQLRIQYFIKELKVNPSFQKHSLDAIAKDIGYSNASSFSKIFKKHTGITPSRFIKDFNQQENDA